MNRIGVMVDCFRLGFEEGVKRAAALGAGAIQMGGTGDFAPAKLSPARRAEIKRIVADAGLAISAVCGDLGGHGLYSAEENQWKLPETLRILDMTAEMGCHVMTTHIGVIPHLPNDARRPVLMEAMQQLCTHAGSVGVRIAIETGPEPVVVLRDFIDELPKGTVGANFDPANLVMVCGADTALGVKTLGKERIVHTHAKDGVMFKYIGPEAIYGFFADGGIEDFRMGDYFLEMPLGQGDVDVPRWIQALSDIGYEGHITIEREVGEAPEKDIAEAIGFLQKLL